MLHTPPRKWCLIFAAGLISTATLMPAAIAGTLEDGKQLLEKKEFAEAAKKFAEGFDAGDGEAGFHLARMVELGVGFAPDAAKARAIYIASAEKGSAAAMNRLGLMHLRGENVRQDFAAASELICKSAELGNLEAQFNCGGLALEGIGREKDPKAAFKYYSDAASKGHLGARNMEAALLRAGIGVDKDVKKAVELFKQNASAGNPAALFSYAEMLEKGEGVEMDPVNAHLYCNLANERGHPGAKALLDRLTAKMTPEQIAEAQGKARNWKPVASVESN